MILFCCTLWSSACAPGTDDTIETGAGVSVCAVLAHPDDETIISGTLAKLVARGFEITVVYVTSGDDGPDETGRGLHGAALGAEREKEALQALQAIGVQNPPIFLKFPDGHVGEHIEAVQQALYEQFNDLRPQVVIGFGPDGITDGWDHKMTGFATDHAFDQTDSGRLLLHMAITGTRSPVYATGVAVSPRAVNVRVNVARYADQRTRAFDAHHTQFPSQARFAYKALVHTMRTESFIIARNRDASEWLERCFGTSDEEGESENDTHGDSSSTSTT
jgi:LmbE family N-acetylglucosaminyl deacetylase